MIKPEQIDAIKDKIALIIDPINNYLMADISRRIAEAGEITSTAEYEARVNRNIKKTEKELSEGLKKLSETAEKELEKLITKVALIEYAGNASDVAMQRALLTAIEMCNEDLLNMTQTEAVGFIGLKGDPQKLMDFYHDACDYAFTKVFTGAQDYQSAIREATQSIGQYGTVYYESGAKTSIDAAIRRNVLGALGIMTEKIQQQNFDLMGADGWEISAHEGSAPDHEPIQGLQYSDAAYKSLNDSLARRISTLNCKHIAFPIVLGVSEPQYTKQELQAMKDRNAKGIDYEGRHYSIYEATQQQRAIERNIRLQRRKVVVAEATGDAAAKQKAQIKEKVLEIKYKEFSEAADLRTQPVRLETLGYGPRQQTRPYVIL